MANRLAGKVAFITGSASGLGRATAEHFLSKGCRVAFADLKHSEGAAIASAHKNAIFTELDVSNEKNVIDAMRKTKEKFGGLNYVVNCAGTAEAVKVYSKTDDHVQEGALFQKTIAINLVGTFFVLKEAVHLMVKNKPGPDNERGVIINTSSIAASDGQVGQAAYAASKAGISGLTLPLAREFAPYGIRVVDIAPGLFMTPLLAKLPPKIINSLAEMVPFPKRLGKPEEYAHLCDSIINNTMLNGVQVRLDGGLRMH